MADNEYQMNSTETVTHGNSYDLPLFKQRSHDVHISQMTQLAMPGDDYSILLIEFISLINYIKEIDFEDHVYLNENGYKKYFFENSLPSTNLH